MKADSTLAASRITMKKTSRTMVTLRVCQIQGDSEKAISTVVSADRGCCGLQVSADSGLFPMRHFICRKFMTLIVYIEMVGIE